MKSDFTQVDFRKNEIMELLMKFGFIAAEYEGGGIACLNEHCEDSTGGWDTKDILTKDEYIISGFHCDECHEITFTSIEAREYDSRFDEVEES